MNPNDIRRIIQATLQRTPWYSRDVEELLFFTAAVETNCGQFLFQVGGGPALGIFQMEPRTAMDILEWGQGRPSVGPVMGFWVPTGHDITVDLAGNIPLQVVLGRLLYLRTPEPIPAYTDHEGIWNLYKKRWNTPLGAAKKPECMAKYLSFLNRK